MARKKKQVDLDAAKVLGEFEGLAVVESAIALVGAGDGLSKAVEVDPVDIKIGDQVKVVYGTHCSQIKFKAHPDDPNKLVRTIVLSADQATIVEAELVAAVLDAQQERIDKAAGVSRIPFDEDSEGDEE